MIFGLSVEFNRVLSSFASFKDDKCGSRDRYLCAAPLRSSR